MENKMNAMIKYGNALTSIILVPSTESSKPNNTDGGRVCVGRCEETHRDECEFTV